MNIQTILMLQVLKELATTSELQTSAAIAPRVKLKLDYMAKLLRILRDNGFVTSVRGNRGGYRLARPARRICVLDVFERVEGGIVPDEPGDSAPLRKLRRRLRDPISESLKNLTIADV